MHSSCCGGWDRTTDLQVMSLTSYHCSTQKNAIFLLFLYKYLQVPIKNTNFARFLCVMRARVR